MRTQIKVHENLRRELRIAVARQGGKAKIRGFMVDSIQAYMDNNVDPADIVWKPDYLMGEKGLLEVVLPDDLHDRLKMFVAFQKERVSMQQVIVDALVWKLKEEDEL